MANKTLTATVKLNTKSAEASLKRLNKLINKLNNTTNKSNGRNLTRNFQNVNRRVINLNNNLNRTNEQTTKVANTTNKVAMFAKVWHGAQNKTVNSIKTAADGLKSCLSRLKAIAGAYLGIMGMRTMINTSDIITSAKNQLNYVNSQQLGAAGTNSDGSYSDATFSATSSDLNKMYASAQKVRMGYTDMIKNVSKSMVLAGDAFDNNTDAAIRFQEVMAEAYAVGGASAEEMSSSMYQLIQALGAGTLAGDELRSVREGAPLAYQSIEEFVQGIYNTDESLKDLAADGKVSSDMVVAAMLNAEGAAKKLDEAFAQTDQTFAQTWQQIKNSATKAFEPVSEMLSKMLNDAIDNGLIEKIESLFTNVSKVLQIVFKVITNGINWIVDNWYWLESIIIPALIALGVLLVGTALVSFSAWVIANLPLILIFISIFAIIWALYAWQSGMISTTDMIIVCLAAIIFMIGMVAVAIGSPVLLGIAAALLLLTVIFYFLEQVLGGFNVAVQAIVNAWFWCGNLIFGVLEWLKAVFHNAIEWIKYVFFGCVSWILALFSNLGSWFNAFGTAIGNVFGAVCDNIGIAFSNAWTWAKNTFWEFIADVIDGVSKLEPVINGIASLLGVDGVDFSELSGSIRNKKTEYKEFVSIGDAWKEGWNTYQPIDLTSAFSNAYQPDYIDLNEAWNKGWNTYDVFGEGWAEDAYSEGYQLGADIKNAINDLGNDAAKTVNDTLNGLGDGNLLNNIGKSLGLDFSPKDPSDGTKEYSMPTAEELLAGIKDDTSNLSDDLDLADDDLEFLRKIAEMEWRNEFTTAEIKVEMTNHNNIQNERDWEDLLTYFSDRIREEATSVADGVHAS